MATTYNEDTPFTAMNLSHAERNVAAFTQLLDHVSPAPRQIVEGFAGTGMQTRVMRERWPRARHQVWDKDPSCAAALREIPGIDVHEEPFPASRLSRDTLLILDHNMITVKHLQKERRLFETGAGQVIFVDTARGKLAVNWDRSYGLSDGRWETYVSALAEGVRDFGLAIQQESRAPRSLTYFYAVRM